MIVTVIQYNILKDPKMTANCLIGVVVVSETAERFALYSFPRSGFIVNGCLQGFFQ